MTRSLTAICMIAAAVLAAAGFTVLGAVFDYPQILDQPADDVLALFRTNQATVSIWFGVLALAAGLLAPIAVGVARLGSDRVARPHLLRRAVPLGVAAALVQVIGLLRWPILVPGFAADAASSDPGVASAGRSGFTTASAILGTTIGETVGYLLSGAWTIMVAVGFGRHYAGVWFQALGITSGILILSGAASIFDVPLVDRTNFLGYVLWSVWLVACGLVILIRDRRRTASDSAMQVSR